MRIDCDSCGAAYAIDDSLISDRGVRAQCPKCGAQKVVKKGEGGGAPAGGPPPGGNPFGAPGGGPPPGGPPPGGNPFGAPGGGAPPPGPPPGGGGGNPFGAPGGGAPAGGPPPGGNPFGAPGGGAPPPGPPPGGGGNPFGAPGGGAPAGGPPPGGGGGTPFGAPGGGAPAGGPPPGGGAAFGAAPPPPPAGAGGDPFGGPGGGPPPGPPPGAGAAPVGGGDPFAAIDAGASDDPFAKLDGGAGGAPNDPDLAAPWQVRVKGDLKTNIPLADLREMIRAGTVGAKDEAGPMGGELGKVADNPVLAVSVPRKPQKQRALGATSSGGGGGRAVLIIVVLAVLGGGAFAALKVLPDLTSGASDEDKNPFRRVKSQWSLQFPEVEGTSDEHVVEGRKYMREDTAAGYRRADEHFRMALLLDTGNVDAIAGYVENFSSLPNAKADADAVVLARDGIDWAKKQSPENPLLFRAEGALLLALGDVDPAQRVLVQARRLAPDDPMTKLLLARTHLDRSVQDALTLVHQVQTEAPDLKQSLSIAGSAHRRLGNFKEARSLLQERLRSDAGNIATLRELARLELDLGNGRSAVTWLDKLIEAEEADVEAHLIRAKITYQVLGEHEPAREQLKFVLENYENVAGELIYPVLTHASHLAAEAGELAEAQTLAEGARAKSGAFTPAHFMLGRIYLKQEKFAEAKASLETAVQQLQSGNDSLYEPVARAVLGDVLSLSGDDDGAKRSFSRVIEYAPRGFRGYFGLAALHMRKGTPSPAFTVMRKALDIDPRHHMERPELTDYPVSNQDLLLYADSFAAADAPAPDKPLKDASEGIIRYHAGQRDQARALFKRAIKADRYNHSALLYLSVMDYEDGRVAGVATRLKRAERTTAGSHTITQLYLARAELATGKLDDAEKRLTDVLDNEPTLVQAKFSMGKLLLKRKKKEEALTLWRDVVENAPDYLPVKRAIAEHAEG